MKCAHTKFVMSQFKVLHINPYWRDKKKNRKNVFAKKKLKNKIYIHFSMFADLSYRNGFTKFQQNIKMPYY